MVAVNNPITGGNPDAAAIPKLRGSASKKTKKPEVKSGRNSAHLFAICMKIQLKRKRNRLPQGPTPRAISRAIRPETTTPRQVRV
jgi:hypothetical protein